MQERETYETCSIVLSCAITEQYVSNLDLHVLVCFRNTHHTKTLLSKPYLAYCSNAEQLHAKIINRY